MMKIMLLSVQQSQRVQSYLAGVLKQKNFQLMVYQQDQQIVVACQQLLVDGDMNNRRGKYEGVHQILEQEQCSISQARVHHQQKKGSRGHKSNAAGNNRNDGEEDQEEIGEEDAQRRLHNLNLFKSCELERNCKFWHVANMLSSYEVETILMRWKLFHILVVNIDALWFGRGFGVNVYLGWGENML